jgi:hypothetical protein
MSTYIAHLVTEDMVTIVTDTGTLSVPSSHVGYTGVVNAIREGDWDTATTLADSVTVVNVFGKGHITVVDGVIWHDGEPLHNSLTSRIIRMMREGFEVTPMLNFLERLAANPSMRARSELYRFLESNSLPITPDGYFLAYKNVTWKYRDKHSGTFDNTIGATCEMPRESVMDDPNQTCSAGLHFCSIEYLNDMWGHSGHTMVIKIDPSDVVSIPTDYNNSKGRCCKYVVIAEHMDGNTDTLSEAAVYGDEDSYDPEGLGDYVNGSGW